MPAGFDQVTICNLALSHVGSKSTIESIDELNNPAKQCKLWYAPARIATLEVFNWGFARRSGTLAPHSVAAPTNRWAYRYAWPVDCLAPRFLENPAGPNADAVPMETEEADDNSSSVVTNLENAVLLYTRDVQNPTRYSMHFTLMMALRLAAFINSPLTGKVAIYNRVINSFNEMATQAPYVDTTAVTPRPERDASWTRARS